MNFSNANKSIEMTPTEIGTAYTAATLTSVLLAVSLTRLVPRLRVSPGTKDVLSKLVPFASVASAGVVKYVPPPSHITYGSALSLLAWQRLGVIC